MKPDKNPKPDRIRPEPEFQKRQKPDPNPIVKTRAGPEPDYLKPVTSLLLANHVCCEYLSGSSVDKFDLGKHAFQLKYLDNI